MKNIYTEFQANFIKHAEDAKKFLHGEFTTENGDYRVFTEDGITAYIIPKAMWWINDDRIAEKFGDPNKWFDAYVKFNLDTAKFIQKTGTTMTAKGELVVMESFEHDLKLYVDPKKFKEFDKPDFTFKAYATNKFFYVYYKGALCALLCPTVPKYKTEENPT